jgi:hypothetical protein
MRRQDTMSTPEKPPSGAEIDELYGLEPVIGEASDGAQATDRSLAAEFVSVACPYCGETFATQADASGGACIYVEDCQVCCQPIEMELTVDEDGSFLGLAARRGDS